MENDRASKNDVGQRSRASGASDEKSHTPGSLPPEKIEDRGNVGTARPEQYPKEDRAAADPAAQNRGRRASKGSGPASGSGAGAGGKGNSEDYDSDPQGGGGRLPSHEDHGPKTGADAPVGGRR